MSPSAPYPRSMTGRCPFPVVALLAAAVVAFAAACGGGGPKIVGRKVTVACGNCIFHMPQAQGCPWAVEIDGHHYIVQGKVPQNHISHEPDGICNMPRQAVVDGVIRGDKFIASRLELLPAENVPESPKYTPADVH